MQKFINYIYCISRTCFAITFTIIRENFCAFYLKLDIVMTILTMDSATVMSYIIKRATVHILELQYTYCHRVKTQVQ